MRCLVGRALSLKLQFKNATASAFFHPPRFDHDLYPRFPDIGQHFHTVRRASDRCNPSLQLPPSPHAAYLLTSTPWIEAIFTTSNPQLKFRVLLLSLNRTRLLSARRLLQGRADERLASPSKKSVRASNRFSSRRSQVVSFHPQSRREPNPPALPTQ